MSYNNNTTGSYQKNINNYKNWLEFIAKGRDKTSRKCDNNTYARIDNNNIAIKLHNTDIVTIDKKDNFTLNSGGWLTVTTKERLNKYTPAGISQKAGIWYLSDGSLFYDGVIVDKFGRVLNPKSSKVTTDYEQRLKAIKKQARSYAKAYVKALEDGLIAYPGGGGCWYCSMITEDKKPLGEAINNTQHLIDHMNEGYFVPSLLVNAGRAAGYRNEQIGLMGIGGRKVFINPEDNIYKYIVKQLQRGL